jgi:hypothetical protein
VINKVLLATINYDHPQSGMLKAFEGIFGKENVFDFDFLQLKRSGVTVHGINSMFINSVNRFNPDWIWLQVQNTKVISPAIIGSLRKPGRVVTNWNGDLWESDKTYYNDVCNNCDISYSSGVRLDDIHLRYLQIGLDIEEDVLGLPDWEPDFNIPDVVFCGSYYGNKFSGTGEREETALALIKEHINFGIVGNNWPKNYPVIGKCEVKQQHHVWKRAKVCINVNNYNDVPKYYSDRQLIAMASGTPLVCKYIPQLEDDFEHGEHLLWFENTEELIRNVKLLLSNQELAKEIGRRGRAEVVRNHTWFSRILSVIPDIERLQNA